MKKLILIIVLLFITGCAIRMAVLLETDDAATGSSFKFENQSQKQISNIGVGV